MNQEINNILKYLKRCFTLLLVFLIVIATFFIIVANKSFSDLNAYSNTTSSNIYLSALQQEQENLENLVLDYSYWTEAVEALTGDIDNDFVDDNFDGAYLKEVYSITGLAVYEVDGQVKITVSDEGKDETPNIIYEREDFKALFKRALLDVNPDSQPVISSFINIKGAPYFVAASAITPSILNQQFSEYKAHGVLLMAKPISSSLLEYWQSNFYLHDIGILQISEIIPEGFISSKLMDPFEKPIFNIVWQPDLPGHRFVNELLPITIILLVISFLVAVLFYFQLSKYIKLTITAVNDLNKSKDELQRLAYFDSITHLPNRLLCMDRLVNALSASQRNNTITAVLFVDLDKFKAVNDTYGHDVGDKLLEKIGRLLDSCIRQGIDTASRLGGDEFIVILTNLKDKKDAVTVAGKIVSLLSEDIVIDKITLNVSASIGISVTSSTNTEPEAMVKIADKAMYKAKEKGRNTYHIEDDALVI